MCDISSERKFLLLHNGIIYEHITYMMTSQSDAVWSTVQAPYSRNISNLRISNKIVSNENIAGSKYENIIFENVIFADCDFQGTEITNCKFVNCKFKNCNFNFSKFDNCNLITCVTENCSFCITNSLNCNFLSCTYINNKYEESTVKGIFINCQLENQEVLHKQPALSSQLVACAA